MSKAKNTNETLRNFVLPDELYFDLEYMAEANKRNSTQHLIFLLSEESQRFKTERLIKKMPRTDRRKRKLQDEG